MKIYSNLHSRTVFFSGISEVLKTHAHKKISFQHCRETKLLQVILFWSNLEIKMPEKIHALRIQ